MNVQDVLLSAIENRLVVRILYRSQKGDVSVRSIEPYEIKNGKCYGYCLEKHGIRAFNLSGISTAKETQEHYVPRFN